MTRRRIGFLVTPALAILVAPLAGEAQPVGHVARIGMLTPASWTSVPAFKAFRHGLRQFGWVEGQNLAIEWCFAEGRPARCGSSCGRSA